MGSNADWSELQDVQCQLTVTLHAATVARLADDRPTDQCQTLLNANACRLPSARASRQKLMEVAAPWNCTRQTLGLSALRAPCLTAV